MSDWPLGEMIVEVMRKSLFYGVAVFVILMLIPTTREMIAKCIGIVGGETGARIFNTIIFMIKEIYRAHITLIWHLFKRKDKVFLSPDEVKIGGAAKEKIKS